MLLSNGQFYWDFCSFINFGNQNLTSLEIEYSIGGGIAQTYNWSGNLSPGATETVAINNVSFTPVVNNQVTISTLNGGGEAGTITVSTALTNINVPSGGRRLALFASEDIIVNESISTTGGPLDVRLSAQGNIQVKNNADITTLGGSFTVTGANDDGDSDVFAGFAQAAGSFLLDSGSIKFLFFS